MNPMRSYFLTILFLTSTARSLLAITLPETLPQEPSEVVDLYAEASFGFSDGTEDWRLQLSTAEGEEVIQFRWRHQGPPFDTASLEIRNPSGELLDELPLRTDNPDGGEFFEEPIPAEDLPGTRPLLLSVQLKDASGATVGQPSNAVLVDALTDDLFENTPTYLETMRVLYGVPGIGGGVYCGEDESLRLFVAGNRRFDGGAGKIQPGDRWHIGSNTKAMTATLIGLLIQYGYLEPGTRNPLDWDSALADLFPEWSAELHPRFGVTTLRHLACHRSGMLMTPNEDAETRDLTPGGKNDDPRAFRREMALRLMSRQHYTDLDETTISNPGERYRYGHGNYLILGAVIEQLTNTDYETALAAFLLNPMNVLTAGFGMPAVDVSPYQPHGHTRSTNYPYPLSRDNGPLPPIWNPAGGLYMSMEDNLKFLRLHLGEQVGILQLGAATLTELHTAHPRWPATPSGEPNPSYGWGWGIGTDLNGGTSLGHDGSYGRFYARMTVQQGWNFPVVSVCNQGNGPKNFMDGPIAVSHLHQHLTEESITKASGGAITFGSSTESGNSRGFRDSILREFEEVTFDFPPGVVPVDPAPLLDPARDSFFSPLGEVDQFLISEAALARAPRVLDVGFDQDTVSLEVTVATESGYLYNTFRNTTLDADSWDIAPDPVEASDGTLDLSVPLGADETNVFFFVEDWLP